MHETHNNCFSSNKHNTILRQTNTDKHESWITAAIAISTHLLLGHSSTDGPLSLPRNHIVNVLLN